ncbi:glycosyltransferase family 4 protein [Maribacter dokdonensis]|uniref:glycosyltransferase family 4 protein n=1 Tax=Maribacter dokdonensis TaxID=320912 RepID=UPI002736AE68|nr:glycosyltransferase family 4 protein [Maribacter dokdonensis]MDP2527937.1 glycosyltransferase family 4 protein [Maribacter dokdonensis]
MSNKKIIRVTTVASSLKILLKGQLSYMNQFYEVIGVSSKDPQLPEVTELEGIRTKGIDMTRKITPFKDLRAVWQLYIYFRKEKPAIVHTHTPKAGTLGLLAALLARVPNRLHTIAGLPLMEATGKKRILLNTVEKITYACATKVYPNSKGLDTFVKQEKFTKPSKLKVIGEGSSNGVNIKHFDPSLFSDNDKNRLKESLHIDNDEIVLIFLGRIVNDKGIHELVDAFVNISKKYKNVTLIVGGTPEKELDPIRPETENILNTHPKIKLAGWIEDVRPYLAISDAMVFPSYREGFPNVVMQAGSMGVPVIASDINGSNEIIISGENGVIVPVKNTELLEKAISEFIERDFNRYSPEKCRQMIIDRYDQRLIWQLLHEEYESLLR